MMRNLYAPLAMSSIFSSQTSVRVLGFGVVRGGARRRVVRGLGLYVGRGVVTTGGRIPPKVYTN